MEVTARHEASQTSGVSESCKDMIYHTHSRARCPESLARIVVTAVGLGQGGQKFVFLMSSLGDSDAGGLEVGEHMDSAGITRWPSG